MADPYTTTRNKLVDEITEGDACKGCAHAQPAGGFKEAIYGYPWRCRRTGSQGKPSGCEWRTTDPIVKRGYAER
jgi:hypothetical protein